MKIKTFLSLLLVVLMISTMTGCSLKDAVREAEKMEEAVEHRVDKVEDALERRVDKVEEAVEHRVDKVQELKNDAGASGEKEDWLTPQEAQQIVLTHAGFSEKDVTRLLTELDYDDRVVHYDIEFRKDTWEYEYEVHGQTGEIISWEKDD